MTRKRVTQPLEAHQIKNPILMKWHREGRYRQAYYKRDVDVWIPHPNNGVGYPPLFIDRPSKQIDFCGLSAFPLKVNPEKKSINIGNHLTLTYPIKITPQYGEFTAFLHAGAGTKITVETAFGKHSPETDLVTNIWKRERPEFKSFLCQLLHENNLILAVDVCVRKYHRNTMNYTQHYWDDQLHIAGFLPRGIKDEDLTSSHSELTKKYTDILIKQIEKDELYKPYYVKWLTELKTIKTDKTLFRELKKWEQDWSLQQSPRGWVVVDNEDKRFFISGQVYTKLNKLREILDKIKLNPRSFTGCQVLSETEETRFAEWVLSKIENIDSFIDKSMMEIYQLFSNSKR